MKLNDATPEEWDQATKKAFGYDRGYTNGGLYYDGRLAEDNVNKPPHYNNGDIECIDAIEAATDTGFEYYLQGNIMKYLWRYRYKEGSQDLKKALWYLNKLIEIRDANKS